MSFYSYLFSADYKRYFKRLRAVARQEKRCFLFLLIDSVFLMLTRGFGMADYFDYRLYRRSSSERRKYFSTKDEGDFYKIVSPEEYKKRYTIKPHFLKDFAKYTKRDFIVPETGKYDEYLAFLEKHPVFMSKPYDGLAGQEVSKVYTDKIADKKAFFESAIANRYFFEELIIQHGKMAELCPASVNTMRIMTFNDHGKPRIIWLGLRVGNGINAIDNFHANGMGVNIDIETGKLYGDAIDKDLNHFTEHPFTHVKFDGFQIPYFEEAKKLVLDASLESDKILVVGWDVAISADGPVIIEGNRRPGFDLVQVLADSGRRDIADSVLASI